MRIPPFALLRKMPVTLALVFSNITVFIVCRLIAGSFDNPAWTITLLQMGAQFSPLTLDREWYRIFTHLFLHGNAIHLLINVYALLYAGAVIETRIGWKKFAYVFFLCATGAALSSMYWNVFSVGLGASGAISGLFGFHLVYYIFLSGRSAVPMLLLLAQFTLFAAVNMIFPATVYADFAALYGGFVVGVMTGLLSFAKGRRAIVSKVRAEYVMTVFLALMFLMMPGYPVRYFKFFQQMVAAEDTTQYLLKDKLTDDDMRTFIRNYHHWKEVEMRLASQTHLPDDLAADTLKLKRYIELRKQENQLKKMVVQQEAYSYLDSVEKLHDIMRRYMDLEYGLWSRIRQAEPVDSVLASRMVTIYYDSTGRETDGPPAAFFRKVVRDSLDRLDGPFREFDNRGTLRIKGSYRRNKRDGVFLYYSAAGRCTEAGRYLDDRKFGKWQTFHPNGRLASEVYHNDGHFVSAVWDPFGNPLVVDGNGKEIQLHPNGVVSVSGEYRHGQKDGVWRGWYDNGEMHFEESYSQGRLLAGKSRNPKGETFIYDESSLYPLPVGGIENFQSYLKGEARAVKVSEPAIVKLSFSVADGGTIADLLVDQSATPMLDAKAREIVLRGPRWLPAREHGYSYKDVRTRVQIDFF